MNSGPLPDPEALHRWLGVVGAVVAPVTLISGLAFYFGYVSTRSRLAHFGVDADALGLASSYYVLNSVSVLYAPVLVMILVWLAVLWSRDYLRRLVSHRRRPRLARNLARATAAAGGVLTALGILGVLQPAWAAVDQGVAAVALGLGPALVVVAYWITVTARPDDVARTATATERMSLVVGVLVVILAVFWVTNVFAHWHGDSQANSIAKGLWTRESVIALDTTNRLYPPADIDRADDQSDYVLETRLSDEAATQSVYRYECFRTLLAHGDRWVLVPARWEPHHGYAVIVTTNDSTRVNVRRFDDLPDWTHDWGADWQCPEVATPPPP